MVSLQAYSAPGDGDPVRRRKLTARCGIGCWSIREPRRELQTSPAACKPSCQQTESPCTCSERACTHLVLPHSVAAAVVRSALRFSLATWQPCRCLEVPPSSSKHSCRVRQSAAAESSRRGAGAAWSRWRAARQSRDVSAWREQPGAIQSASVAVAPCKPASVYCKSGEPKSRLPSNAENQRRTTQASPFCTIQSSDTVLCGSATRWSAHSACLGPCSGHPPFALSQLLRPFVLPALQLPPFQYRRRCPN